jgi:autotransporter-associated beta strand protein
MLNDIRCRPVKWLGFLPGSVTAAAVLAVALISTPAISLSASYTWDSSGDTPLEDGPGSWNASGGTNWYDGSSFGSWNNTTASTATFGVGNGTAGTITVGAVTANRINFAAVGSGTYTLSSGTITLGGGTPTLSVDAGVTPTISSVIAGASGLTKSGSGQLTLSGPNTYSGATSITGAGSTLVIAHDAGLGATGGTNSVTVSSGGVLALQGGISVGNKPLFLSSANLVGLRNLSGSNLYGGSIQLNHNSIIDSVSGSLTITGSITGGGVRTLTFQGAGDTTVNGTLSALGGNNFTKNGTGRLTLHGDNSSLTGGVSIAAGGSVRITKSNGIGPSNAVTISGSGALELEDLGTDGLVMTKAFTLSSNAILRNIAGDNTASGAIALGGSGARIESQGGRLTVTQNYVQGGGVRGLIVGGQGEVLLSGNWTGIVNNFAFSKDGTGLAVLSGSNSWGGTTTVSGGVLRLSSEFAQSGGIAATGGTFNLAIAGGVVELGYNDFQRGLGNLGTQVRFTGDGGFSAFGADRSVNLGGASATVTWGTNSFVPTGSSLLLGSEHANATVDFQNPINLGASGITRTIRAVKGSGSVAVDAQLSGILSGSASFTKVGDGRLRLSAVNSFTGATLISEGILEIGATGRINSTSGVTIDGTTAEFKYNSTTALTQPITFNQGTISGTGTIATAVTVAANDVISPGNSPGIQAYTSLHAWAPGGTYAWELNALTGSAGDQWDLVNVSSGTFSLSGLAPTPGNKFILDLITLNSDDVPGQLVNPYDGGSFTFAITSYDPANFLLPDGFSNTAGQDLTSLFTINLGNWQGPQPQASNISVKINSTATGIDLVIVPEPGAIALAGIGIAAAAWSRRRRK